MLIRRHGKSLPAGGLEGLEAAGEGKYVTSHHVTWTRRDAPLVSRPHPPRSCDAPRSHAMSTQALYNQISAKWNNSFNRLNRGEPGISGLLSFSQVRHPRDLSGRATLINHT